MVFIGRYKCNSNFKSETRNTPYHDSSASRAKMRNGIHSLGSNIFQFDFCMLFTIWLLYLVEFADWNSQEKIGYGGGDGGYNPTACGYTDEMPYHTGTMARSRDTYKASTQYRNIEGLWENEHQFVDGIYVGEKSYISQDVFFILNPNNFSDSSNGTGINFTNYLNGVPSIFKVYTINNFTFFFPIYCDGSNSTYSCDSFNINDTNHSTFYNGGYYDGKRLDIGLFDMYNQNSTAGGPSCILQELP